ncbi:MAG: putative acyltransferase [Burkholderia sp.]|nr:putative acyltransferase [Burkholderia sp.]
MPSNFSAYLDLVRFLAAMVVFLGHASGIPWTAGFLWQLGPYGDTCVVIFFVLSGFVIGYVSDEKEHTAEAYLTSRAARLWSVVVPALALTFVVDWFGVRTAPELYLGQPWFAGDYPLLRYLASFLMLQEVWNLHLVPGVNGPFWSLSYEAFYYLLFGIIFYGRHTLKWVAVALLMVLSGPVIAALFPVWGMGFLAYRVCRDRTLPRPLCLFLALAGFALLAASPFLRSLPMLRFQVMGDEILGRYIEGLAFFMHLVGAYGLAGRMSRIPDRLRLTISTVAATTFPLYLLHRPLIQLFSYLGPDDASSWQRRIMLIAGTLLVVWLATPAIEKLRLIMRSKLNGLLARVRQNRQAALSR